MSGTTLYVYYKVEPARLAALRSAVKELFGALERECGVRGRWMRRRDDPGTYMEVYEGVRDFGAFEAALARESGRLGLADLVGGGGARRNEIFVAAE
jgi:hypothetical protein